MNMFLVYLCIFVLLRTAQGFTDDQCTNVGNKTEGRCQSPGYPNKCTSEKYCCDFAVDAGYQIEVIVEDVQVDGSCKDYMVIKPNDKEGFMFTWMLKEKKFYLIQGTSVRIESETTVNSDTCKGYSVLLKRYGEKPTTPVPTTTQPNWPTPDKNESIFYTIFLAGLTPKEFAHNELEFRNIVANMSKEYCSENHIPVIDNITELNVHIDLAIECPVQWPNYKTCVEVRFAVPVFLQNGTDWGYQLSPDHLERMWKKFGPERIKPLGWIEYSVPDDYSTMLSWLAISVIVTVVFFILLFYIKYSDYCCVSKRKMDDTEQIITKHRISDTSLWPMAGQVVPPLFGNDNAYYCYEPDEPPGIKSNSPMHDSFRDNMISLDELSDDEILNVVNMPQKGIILQNDAHNTESVL